MRAPGGRLLSAVLPAGTHYVSLSGPSTPMVFVDPIGAAPSNQRCAAATPIAVGEVLLQARTPPDVRRTVFRWSTTYGANLDVVVLNPMAGRVRASIVSVCSDDPLPTTVLELDRSAVRADTEARYSFIDRTVGVRYLVIDADPGITYRLRGLVY